MKPLYEWLGLTASLGFVDIPDYEYDEEKRNYIITILSYDEWAFRIRLFI